MKCFECGAEMKERKETIRDHRLGLSGVVLKDVPVRSCPKCGEKEILFPQIAKLHKLLARVLIAKKSRLVGEEVRYLRKYLGLSGADLALRLGVAAETVSRWENDKDPIGATADRALRLMVAVAKPISDYDSSELESISAEEPHPSSFNVKLGDHGYELVGSR
jgi:putative zinc finger/helix-turn-helix YgiT family protein